MGDEHPIYNTSLSGAVLKAYHDSAMESLFADPLYIPKWDPVPPLTKWQRRKRRWRYLGRRLLQWRIRIVNLDDGWHNREDCEW